MKLADPRSAKVDSGTSPSPKPRYKSTFSGFTSRWITPIACRKSRASSYYLATAAITPTE